MINSADTMYFKQAMDNRMLSKEQVTDFNTNGYLLFDRLIGKTDIADLRAAAGRILEALAASGPLSTSALAKRLGLTTRTIRTHLARLNDRGLVLPLGQGSYDPHRTWTTPSP